MRKFNIICILSNIWFVKIDVFLKKKNNKSEKKF